MQLIKWDKIRTAIETTKDIETLTKIKDRLRAYQMLAEQSKASQDVQARRVVIESRRAQYKDTYQKRLLSWRKEPYLDHCHKTKTIRGLLCNDCNVGLARFKDNPLLLDKAKEYLGRIYGQVA